MRYLAVLLFACILSVLAGVKCSPKQGITAAVTVDVAFDILSTSYALESSKAEREECQAYACVSVDQCPSISECPAQQRITAKWEPIWHAYEVVATSVELGDSDGARRGYCVLRVNASALGVPLPKPSYPCE